MQETAHEGIADTHGIYHIGDVVDGSLQQCAVRPQQGSQRMVVRSHHVAHTHQPVTQSGILGMQVVEPFPVFVHLHLEV